MKMWQVCVGLLVLCGTCSTQLLQMSPSQSVFSRTVGSTLEVNCTNKRGGNVEWTMDGSDQLGSGVEIRGFVSDGDENVASLTIAHITTDEANTYRCITDGGEVAFELRVFTVTTQDAEFTENDNAVLKCHVEDPGTYTYIWKKGDTYVSDIPVEGKQAFITNGNGTLEIRNPARTAAGSYSCFAVNESSGDQQNTFIVANHTLDFKQNENRVLPCKRTEPGLYTYTWKKDGKPVGDVPLEGNQALITHINGTLEARHADQNLSGEYTCIARDVKLYSIEREVYYYATPKVLPFTPPKVVTVNTTLMMECKVLGYPLPSISWWKGDKNATKINGGGSSRYKLSPGVHNGMRMESAKLEIDRVASDDGGMYMCMATASMWPGFNSTQTVLVRVNDGTSPSNAVRAGLLSIFIGPCLLLMFLAFR